MALTSVDTLIGPVAQQAMGAPIPSLIEAYVQAARILCIRSGWLTEEIPITTVADDKDYTLAASDPTNTEIIGVRMVEVDLGDGRDNPFLDRRAKRRWLSADAPNEPEFYDFEPDSTLLIHPAPDDAYDLTVTLILRPKLGVQSIDTLLVTRWDEAMRVGALAQLQDIPEQPWTSHQRANDNRMRFERYCHQAASAAAKRFQRGVRPVA